MVARIIQPGSSKILPAVQAAAKAGQSDQQTIDALRETLLLRDYELGVLKDVAKEMMEAADPDTLDAIADEITSAPGDGFKHSARAASLRSLAKRLRAAILKAEKVL